MATPRSLRSKLIASFGIAWITLLLGEAIYRLTPLAIEPWRAGTMSPALKALWIGWFVVNAYFEGYRGFQKRFSPRVVGRAAYLGDHPTLLRVVLAPFFCLSMFHARRSQLIFRYTFLAALYTLIYFVRFLPQPWRGILDGGVVVALAWGLGAVWYFFGRYLLDLEHPAAGDLPEGAQPTELTPTLGTAAD
jgi:hypothetical protein